MALVKRHLTFRFQLGQGSFGNTGSSAVEVSGLRASVAIVKAGGVSQSKIDAKIYGLPPSVMNQLTILGKPLVDGRNNRVTILAGDDKTGMAAVFEGTIAEAWVDARNAPQVGFIVSAFDGLLTALKPSQPVSFDGTVDAATIVAQIAQTEGLSFTNEGVQVQISNPYLYGTALSQLQDIARAGNFNCQIVTENGVTRVVIWPAGKARGGQVPLISAETGLVGFPMRTENGIELQTLFNPGITFGGQIRVRSVLTPANGDWTVFRVAHDLESETPGGKWFTTLECSIFGQSTPVVTE